MASETHITLTPIDHAPPGNYTVSLNYLPLKPGVSFSQAYEFLQKGLRATFSQLPWLSGRVWPQSPDTSGWRPGQREIRYDASANKMDGRLHEQFKYHELESGLSYSEIKDMAFPLDAFDDESVISMPFMPDINAGPDVFVAQANFIPGACVLAACGPHSATDGAGITAIMKLWADNCRVLSGQPSETVTPPGPECSSRDVLEQIWAQEWKGSYPVDPESWRVLGLDPPTQQANSGRGNAREELHLQCRQSKEGQISRSALFYMSPANFAALQHHCRQDDEGGGTSSDGGAGSDKISGIDAICALLWRCLLQVRVGAAQKLLVGASSSESAAREKGDLDLDQLVRLDLLVNGRNDYSALLPNPYLGNLTVVNQCFMPCSALIAATTSLGTVARTIRRAAARSINPARLLDAYALAREVDDFGKLVLRNSAIDGSSMVLSPLLMVPTLDFGGKNGGGVFENGGQPEATRMLTRAMNVFTRTGFVLPRLANGGVEFVVNVFEEELAMLLEDADFGTYAEFLS